LKLEAEVGRFESLQQSLLGGHPPNLLDLLAGKPPAEPAGPPAASEGWECGMARFMRGIIHRFGQKMGTGTFLL